MEELFKALLQNGPGFLLAAVMLWLFIGQRNDYKVLVKEQREDAVALTALLRESAKIDAEHRATIEHLRDAQRAVDKRLEDVTNELRELRRDRGDLTGPINVGRG